MDIQSASPNNQLVLVIEDDHDTRVALRRGLEEAGFVVASTANGADGLKLLQNISRPAFILLAMDAPIINGEQFLLVLSQTPEHATIPVIQMSPRAGLRLAGTRCEVTKPVQVAAVLKLIADWNETPG